MITFMSKVICITNRKLAEGNFLQQIRKIAAAGPEAIILREKDLSEAEYGKLAAEVLTVCREKHVKCILHTYPEVAVKYQADGIHLPLPCLRQFSQKAKERFPVIGSSAHSVEEALEAQELGAMYITAGHVFETDCKKGIMPHGLAFLEEICSKVSIPVYALGGVSVSNGQQCLKTGAAGLCMMSEFMKSDNPNTLLSRIKNMRDA